ncbi:3'(2'),5'-bisphosphate nucleotidase CysQ [Guyparkeria hydrothermalis]|uniref:3'(2'),5'-bisphosphate nucleotidase CysQ n=1 Tax=Guyparkeria hydrothermalis TaxID=923 RepID=UPI002021643A|nr:3'(2'),5'-bisphosphate nucleotidase CysQ [Guyparkeria hydrothermalis]MCL7745131.1 3'(2'),5'-bisphosphate nucleotidase CysQ [Guyparkeria hydrothermalis]
MGTPAGVDRALLDEVRAIAEAAGHAIMRVYEQDFAVERKADASPVTEADLVANQLIAEQLAGLGDGWPVLTEEARAPAWHERREWQRYWLVDPLDGTREFVKRNGEFSVNIALIDAGEPVLGVVFAPAIGLEYAAIRGAGAWRYDDGQACPIRVRAVAEPPTLALSRSHASRREMHLIETFSRPGGDRATVVRCGSSLKTCLVAEGKADLYPRLGPTSEWDTAASQCVLETAGGYLTDLAGRPLRYNTRESLLNPMFVAHNGIELDFARLHEIAAL